jgi:hypothetical protein
MWGKRVGWFGPPEHHTVAAQATAEPQRVPAGAEVATKDEVYAVRVAFSCDLFQSITVGRGFTGLCGLGQSFSETITLARAGLNGSAAAQAAPDIE